MYMYILGQISMADFSKGPGFQWAEYGQFNTRFNKYFELLVHKFICAL